VACVVQESAVSPVTWAALARVARALAGAAVNQVRCVRVLAWAAALVSQAHQSGCLFPR